MKSNTHQKVCAKCNPAATGDYTILHKIFQNLRQSFFLTHCVTLTENMRLVIQCKLNTVLLPRPPIEFVKHCIICEPAGSKGSRACDLYSAVDTTRFTSSVSRGVVSATGDGGDAAARGGTGLRPAPRNPRRARSPCAPVPFHSRNSLKIRVYHPITNYTSSNNHPYRLFLQNFKGNSFQNQGFDHKSGVWMEGVVRGRKSAQRHSKNTFAGFECVCGTCVCVTARCWEGNRGGDRR